MINCCGCQRQLGCSCAYCFAAMTAAGLHLHLTLDRTTCQIYHFAVDIEIVSGYYQGGGLQNAKEQIVVKYSHSMVRKARVCLNNGIALHEGARVLR